MELLNRHNINQGERMKELCIIARLKLLKDIITASSEIDKESKETIVELIIDGLDNLIDDIEGGN
jgi:hypothetical protein